MRTVGIHPGSGIPQDFYRAHLLALHFRRIRKALQLNCIPNHKLRSDITSENILQKFEEIASPVFQQIKTNQQENHHQAVIHDEPKTHVNIIIFYFIQQI